MGEDSPFWVEVGYGDEALSGESVCAERYDAGLVQSYRRGAPGGRSVGRTDCLARLILPLAPPLETPWGAGARGGTSRQGARARPGQGGQAAARGRRAGGQAGRQRQGRLGPA